MSQTGIAPTFKNDPRWKEPSASLREGRLYPKMPVSYIHRVALGLQEALRSTPQMEGPGAQRVEDLRLFLLEQAMAARSAGQSSVFLEFLPNVVEADLHVMKQLFERSEDLDLYIHTLEQGLVGNPQVDWISRVEGPSNPRDAAFQEVPLDLSEAEIMDLFSK